VIVVTVAVAAAVQVAAAVVVKSAIRAKKKQTHYMYRWKTVGGGIDKRRAGTERVVQYQPHAVRIQLYQLAER